MLCWNEGCHVGRPLMFIPIFPYYSSPGVIAHSTWCYVYQHKCHLMEANTTRETFQCPHDCQYLHMEMSSGLSTHRYAGLSWQNAHILHMPCSLAEIRRQIWMSTLMRMNIRWCNRLPRKIEKCVTNIRTRDKHWKCVMFHLYFQLIACKCAICLAYSFTENP